MTSLAVFLSSFPIREFFFPSCVPCVTLGQGWTPLGVPWGLHCQEPWEGWGSARPGQPSPARIQTDTAPKHWIPHKCQSLGLSCLLWRNPLLWLPPPIRSSLALSLLCVSVKNTSHEILSQRMIFGVSSSNFLTRNICKDRNLFCLYPWNFSILIILQSGVNLRTSQERITFQRNFLWL